MHLLWILGACSLLAAVATAALALLLFIVLLDNLGSASDPAFTHKPTNRKRPHILALHNMATVDARQEPFPAPSRQKSGQVNGIATDVSCIHFADKVVVTISQDGRLAQWVQVPLSAPSPALVDMSLPRAELSLLPSVHLEPKTLVGGGGQDRETIGQLYAAQVASHLALRNPDDRRTLVLGIGLQEFDLESRESFFDIIELVLQVL